MNESKQDTPHRIRADANIKYAVSDSRGSGLYETFDLNSLTRHFSSTYTLDFFVFRTQNLRRRFVKGNIGWSAWKQRYCKQCYQNKERRNNPSTLIFFFT